jgi:hypothetical protein
MKNNSPKIKSLRDLISIRKPIEKGITFFQLSAYLNFELKEFCVKNNIKTSGNKRELLKRIINFLDDPEDKGFSKKKKKILKYTYFTNKKKKNNKNKKKEIEENDEIEEKDENKIENNNQVEKSSIIEVINNINNKYNNSNTKNKVNEIIFNEDKESDVIINDL